MENCLIGKNVVINAKCRLNHCTIEGGYEVSKDTQAKDETFEGFELGENAAEDFELSYNGSDEDDDSDEGSEYSEDQGDFDDDGLFDRS